MVGRAAAKKFAGAILANNGEVQVVDKSAFADALDGALRELCESNSMDYQPPWRDHLTPAEADRLEEIERTKQELRKEGRKIFDRARKRLLRP
jgi:hypothetical protein